MQTDTRNAPRLQRSEVAMVLLAIFFPIHFFFLGRKWWGIALFGALPVLGVVGALTMDTFAYVVGIIGTLVVWFGCMAIWLFGIAMAVPWTRAYNARIQQLAEAA